MWEGFFPLPRPSTTVSNQKNRASFGCNVFFYLIHFINRIRAFFIFKCCPGKNRFLNKNGNDLKPRERKGGTDEKPHKTIKSERVVMGMLALCGIFFFDGERGKLMKNCVKPSLVVLGMLVACGMFFMTAASTYAETPFSEFSVVRQKCSVCHKLDQNKNVEVIAETRKTPEEWKVVVERMIRINGAPIEDAEFEPVIKQLCDYLILSPKEMAEVAYFNSDENSQFDEVPQNETGERIFTACVRCHTYGKILSHKKTLQQWKENMHMHLGYYPTAVPQMREMDWPTEAMELAEVLAKLLPYDNPEWETWMKNREQQNLTGEWKVAGFQPGMGYYEGKYVFKAHSTKEDEYLVEKEVRYENGTVQKMAGEGILYGEYHLRYALAPTPITGRIEGVFDLNAAEQGFCGKWWTVVQDTNGYGDEQFYRVDGAPRVFGVYPKAIAASGKSQTLTLVGCNLPKIKAADISFADSSVKVEKVVRADNNVVVCQVKAANTASQGACALTVAGVACENAVKVFSKIDRIEIFPPLGRARVSCGAAYPPHGVQFVARGVSNGQDGKPDTADDLILEPVAADWWLEEESTRDNDDDLKYLQAPIVNGLYTPVTTYGPIEERVQRREGIGLIAVCASYTCDGVTLKDRSLLAVTDTDFIVHIK